MKSLGLLIWVTLSILSSGEWNLAPAQVTSQNPPATDQWVSHQMNQPPPGTDKYSISQQRLEEIRQLYLQAKQELEKKTDKKPGDTK
ncbi:MAG: hypothetical protein ACLQPD_29515 [Desulfomonilaceae bacterium]